jgi:DNA-binding MarR family transcriptional regulator
VPKELITMKRKTKTKTSRAKKPAKPVRAGTQLKKVMALIRSRPGIRPSEINRRLKLAQSDAPRAALIKRGLIRKEKDGSAVRYFAVLHRESVQVADFVGLVAAGFLTTRPALQVWDR